MYLESVEFQREKNSKWEKGFYIGRTDNDYKEKSIFLDENYQPLPRDEEGFQVWNARYDMSRDIQVRVSIKDEK